MTQKIVYSGYDENNNPISVERVITKVVEGVEAGLLLVDYAPGVEYRALDTGNVYQKKTAGQTLADWTQTKSGGADHFTQSGWFPKGTTEKAQYVKDIANYTNHASEGVVSTAEITTITFTVGAKVTAVLVSPRMGVGAGTSFLGYYLTVNATDIGSAATELQTDTSTSKRRVWVPKDSQRLVTFSQEITRVDIVAIDDNTTPNNQAEIEPF